MRTYDIFLRNWAKARFLVVTCRCLKATAILPQINAFDKFIPVHQRPLNLDNVAFAFVAVFFAKLDG